MWLLILGLVFLGACCSSGSEGSSGSSDKSLDVDYYDNGDYRVRNFWDTGYYYSNGVESYEGIFGEEHRSDGTMCTTDFFGMNHVYDEETGEEIAIEYEDFFGMRHRDDV